MGLKQFGGYDEISSMPADGWLLVDPQRNGQYKRITKANAGIGSGGGGGDTLPPGIVSMQVTNANPNQIVVVMNENSILTTLGWSFRRNLANWVINSVSGSGTTWTFTMATAAVAGETIDGSYNSGTGNTVDLASPPNELVTFSNAGVTNNVAGGGLDADAQAFFTAAGITDPTQQGILNTQLVGHKTDTHFASKILDWWPAVGATANRHRTNAKRPTTPYNLLYVGSPTHGSQGIVCPAGANGAEIDIVPSVDMDIADLGLGIYAHDNVAVSTLAKFLIGCQGLTPNNFGLYIIPRFSNDQFYCAMTDGGGNVQDVSTDSRGFWFMTRTANNVGKLYKNGVQVGTTFASVQTTLPNQRIGVGGGRENSSGTYTSGENTVTQIFRTLGMSDADVLALSNRVNAAETALGRNTY